MQEFTYTGTEGIKSTIVTNNKELSQCRGDTPNKGSDFIDWQEKYIDNLDKSVQDIKNEVKDMRTELKNEFDTKFNQFMNELRDRDNQRHLEIITMSQRMDENLKEIKIDIKSTKSEIQTTNKWIMGLVVAASLSFLGIAISLSIGMVNVINIINNLVTK